MSSLFFFRVNPVGATLAGIPLTTISKSYDWGGVFVALELASLFCCCLLIGARNVSRHMIDPSKFEWILYKNQEIKKIMVWTTQPLTFDLFTPGVKTWNFKSYYQACQLLFFTTLFLTFVNHPNWNIQMTNEHFIFQVSIFLHNWYI